MPTYDIVLCVTNDLNYDQRMQRICASLRKKYKNIALVGRSRNFSKPLRPSKYHQQRLHCFFNKGFLFYAEYNIRLLIFLLQHHSSTICAIDLDSLPACYLASRLRKSKLIFDAHEYFLETPELMDRPFVKWFWKRIEKSIVPRVNYAYTVSNSVAEYYRKSYGKTFHLIRNVPSYKSVVKEQNSPKILIYQGVLNKGRGLELLMEAVCERKDCTLWLVGEGDISNELKRLAVEKKAKNIVFKGNRLPQDLFKLSTQASIGINLLDSKSLNYYYSLANKFFDYVQAEIPSICMAFPEYKKMNDEYEVALLIEDLNKEALNAAIDRLISSEELYAKLVQNCREAKKAWNWEKEEVRLMEFYDKIL